MTQPRSLFDTNLAINMQGCARCQGEGHDNIHFNKFTHPIGDFTHWALCPTNGEPILMASRHVPLENELEGLSVADDPKDSP